MKFRIKNTRLKRLNFSGKFTKALATKAFLQHQNTKATQ